MAHDVLAPAPRANRQFKTVDQLANSQPGLSVGSIRWDLFRRSENGLAASGAVIRRGRRILLDEGAYLDWLASKREGAQ